MTERIREQRWEGEEATELEEDEIGRAAVLWFRRETSELGMLALNQLLIFLID